MSRVGRKPIDIVKGVTVKINGSEIAVNGPKGDLKINTRAEVKVTLDEDNKQVVVERTSETRLARAMHGTTRSLIQNMIVGVTEGYQKDLQIVGVGWGANLKGNKVELNLGYADTRIVEVPSHINCEVKGQSIKISGADKQAVGQLAAKIRQHRKPEPYNGKGVMFVGERVLRKQGKAFGS